MENIDVFRPRTALLWGLAHMMLAVMMYRSPMLASLHGLFTIAWCTYTACRSKRIETIAVAMAYVVGAEVLWRSTNARVPHETGKYLICLMSFIAMTRFRQQRLPWLPLLYLLFLLPSVILTLTEPIQELGAHQTTFKVLVFNMVGPVTLTFAACFFTRVRLNAVHLLNVFLGLAAPCAGLAALTIFAIKTGGNVTFGRSAVSVISEEFGPNQLSAAVGLGALMLLLMLMLDERATVLRRVVMIGGVLFMLVASALTFSRGGSYNFAGATIVALFFLLRDAGSRVRIIGGLTLAFMVGNYLVLPSVDNMTGGFLVKRFSSTDLTGRDTIAWVDMRIWNENPVYGVGPGRAVDSRVRMFRLNQAHTEFTRMFAEHGTLGFVSLCVLIVLALNCMRLCPGPRSRAVTAALLVWGFLFMTNAAMRLSAPSFAIGLACAFFDCEFKGVPLRRRRRPLPSMRARKTLPAPVAHTHPETA